MKRRKEKSAALGLIVLFLLVGTAVAIFIATLFGQDDNFIIIIGVSVVLLLVAVGVFLIVRTSCIWGAYQTLLEEGDYSRADKKVDRSVAPIYWLSVVVIYLAISFLTFKWHMTWIIWPVAGVLYGLIAEIFKRKK